MPESVVTSLPANDLWGQLPYPEDDHNRRNQYSQHEQIPTIWVPDRVNETVYVCHPSFISYRYRLAFGKREQILRQHRWQRENRTSDQHGDYPLSRSQGGGYFHAMVIRTPWVSLFFSSSSQVCPISNGQQRFDYRLELVPRTNTHYISENKSLPKLKL